MKIIEHDRRRGGTPTVFARPVRNLELEVERLTRQLRRATERNSIAFDQGFAAATAMVVAGATSERLVEASGVVAIEWDDTEPVSIPYLLEEKK